MAARASGGTRRTRQPRSAAATRIEHDTLGSLPLPAAALYGTQTARAVENLRKRAAGRANLEAGV
jgi:aspartate ammonia-lyase